MNRYGGSIENFLAFSMNVVVGWHLFTRSLKEKEPDWITLLLSTLPWCLRRPNATIAGLMVGAGFGLSQAVYREINQSASCLLMEECCDGGEAFYFN